eukprot:jgi/Mesvir1/8188/Mv12485-RA.2
MTAFAAKNAEKRSLSVSRTRKLSETERARLQGLLDRENSKGAITVARLQATNKKAAQAPRPRSAADRKPSNSGRAASARGKSSSTPLPGFRGNNRLGRSSGSSTPHSGPDYAHPRDDKFEIVDLVRSRPSTASSHYGTRAFQDTLRSAGTSPSAFDGTSRLKPGVLANPATPLDGHDQGSAQVVSQTRVQEGLFPTGAGNDPHVHWQGNQSGPTRSKTHPRPGVSLSPRTTGAATPVRTATDSQGQQTTPRSSSAHAPRSVAPSATKQSTRTGVGNEQASGPRLGPTQAWAAQVPEPTPSQVDKNNNEAPAPKQGVVAPDVEAKAGTLQGGCVPAEEEGEGDVRVLSLPVFRVLGNKVTLEELLRDKVLQRAQGFKAAQLLQLQLRTLDAEGTGSIPADRLAAFLDMWQVALTDRQLAAVCDQYDDDGSGELSIDLFVRGVLTEAFGSNPGLAGRPVSAGTGASSQRGGSGRTPQHPRSGKKLLRSAGTTGFQDGLYTESMAGVDVGGSVTAASSGVSSGTSTAATAPIPVLVPMRKQRYLPPSAELLPAELAFRDYLARECGAMGSGGGNRAAGARPPTPRSSATPATATPTATTPRGRGGESGVALGENRGMLVSRGGGAQLTYEAAYECFKRLASSLGISLTGNTASNNSVTHSQLRALFRRAALDVADTDMEDLLRRHDASWRGRIHVAPLLHALVRKGDNGEGEDARERAAAVLRQLQEYLHSECIGLRAAFNMLDRAGSGMVGPSGVHALCTLLGVRGADEDVVRAILSLLDGDGDGSVSFHDFVVRMKAVEREMVDGLGRSMGDEMRELHQQQRRELRAIAGECSTEPGGGPGVNYHELLASLRNVLRVQATSTSSARHSTAPNEAQGTTTSITRPDRGAVPGVLDALTGPKEPVKVRETQVPSRLTVSQLESLVASKLGQRGRPGMAGMLRLAFQWFDRDVEGRIPHDAFRQQLARLNIALDDDTWQAVLRKYDPRDSGYVNFHQFMSAVLPSSDMASIMSARATSYTMDNEGFRRALQGMDRDNSGSLPQATVWQALVDKGYSVPHGIFTQLCTKCRMDAPVPGGAPGGPLYQPPRVDYIHFCELLQEAERVQLGLQGVGFVNRSKPAKSAEGDKAAKRPPLLAWVGAEDVQAGISTELGEQKRGGKRQGIANTPPLPMAMMETRVVPKLRKAMQDHRPELAVATAEAPAGRALRELDANVDARHALAHNDDRQHGGNSWGTPYNERPGTNVHPTYSLGSTQVLRVHDD